MRAFFTVVAAALLFGGVAHAQTAPRPKPGTSYVQVLGDAAYDNGGGYSVEAGMAVGGSSQLFVEGGRVTNAATAQLQAGSQLVAGHLAQTRGDTAVSAREPVLFGVVGVRHLVVTETRLQPYVLGGAGLANVRQEVRFTVGGADVTNNLQPSGETVGSTLSRDFTRPLMMLGVGLVGPLWQRVVVDLHVRFGRILAGDQSLSVCRGGIGLGVRF